MEDPFIKIFFRSEKNRRHPAEAKLFFHKSSAFSFSLVGPNIARISRWPAMKLFFQHWVGDAIDPWWALFLPHCFHLCAKLHDQKSHQTQKFHHLTNAGIYQLHVTLCCFCLYSLEPEKKRNFMGQLIWENIFPGFQLSIFFT